MIIFTLSLLLVLALSGIVVLVWYTRKLIQILRIGVENIDEMQMLLTEYADLLAPIATMENYYGDPAITSAVANTKLVIQACQVYKKTILEDTNEETQEDTEVKEAARKAEATIGPVTAEPSQTPYTPD